jgi:Fe-S cluster assembly protein SufD
VVRDQAARRLPGPHRGAEGADRTDARMGHHALILSDRAEVDAKPELEIYADDVACAHGNTVGAWTRTPCSTPASAACPRTRPARC